MNFKVKLLNWLQSPLICCSSKFIACWTWGAFPNRLMGDSNKIQIDSYSAFRYKYMHKILSTKSYLIFCLVGKEKNTAEKNTALSTYLNVFTKRLQRLNFSQVLVSLCKMYFLTKNGSFKVENLEVLYWSVHRWYFNKTWTKWIGSLLLAHNFLGHKLR